MLGQKRRFDPAGADGIDADAQSRIFDCGDLGQADNTVLGGRVGCCKWQSNRTEGGRHVDDGPSAALQHGGNFMLHAVEDAVQVDVHQVVPIVERVVCRRLSGAVYACIVDRQMQTAACLDSVGDQLFHSPGIRDIDRKVPRPPTL